MLTSIYTDCVCYKLIVCGTVRTFTMYSIYVWCILWSCVANVLQCTIDCWYTVCFTFTQIRIIILVPCIISMCLIGHEWMSRVRILIMNSSHVHRFWDASIRMSVWFRSVLFIARACRKLCFYHRISNLSSNTNAPRSFGSAFSASRWCHSGPDKMDLIWICPNPISKFHLNIDGLYRVGYSKEDWLLWSGPSGM